MPRQTIFERLGRRYGVELFLGKEIISLYREFNAPEILIINEHIRVDDAVQQALSRDRQDIYNPVVIRRTNSYTMLDMQSLIIKQAEMLSNLGNIANNLNTCEAFTTESKEEIGVEKIIDALREVVPFHDAGIFTYSKIAPISIKGEEFIHTLSPSKGKSTAFSLPLLFQQTICLDDTKRVLLWKDIIGTKKITRKHGWVFLL